MCRAAAETQSPHAIPVRRHRSARRAVRSRGPAPRPDTGRPGEAGPPFPAVTVAPHHGVEAIASDQSVADGEVQPREDCDRAMRTSRASGGLFAGRAGDIRARPATSTASRARTQGLGTGRHDVVPRFFERRPPVIVRRGRRQDMDRLSVRSPANFGNRKIETGAHDGDRGLFRHSLRRAPSHDVAAAFCLLPPAARCRGVLPQVPADSRRGSRGSPRAPGAPGTVSSREGWSVLRAGATSRRRPIPQSGRRGL